MSQEKYEQWKKNIREAFKNKSIEEKQRISKLYSEIQQKLKNENFDYYRKIKQAAGRKSQQSVIKYKKNKLETKVENWLLEHHIRNTYSPIISGLNKTHQYDFIIHNKRILIEVQGDYWHANPLFYDIDGKNDKKILNQIQLKNIENDKDKKLLAEHNNFKILYIWEYDINKNDFSALKELLTV